MKQLIKYTYNSWTEGCGCCSNSYSQYDRWEDGVLVAEDVDCGWFENEAELREELAHLEPFDVDPDSRWF